VTVTREKKYNLILREGKFYPAAKVFEQGWGKKKDYVEYFSPTWLGLKYSRLHPHWVQLPNGQVIEASNSWRTIWSLVDKERLQMIPKRLWRRFR
jgi:hypothetical protein